MSTNKELLDRFAELDLDDAAAVDAAPIEWFGAQFAKNASEALNMPDPSEAFMREMRALYAFDIDRAERWLSGVYARNNARKS